VPADRSLDFTPAAGTLNAREACRSAVARQAHDGYVVEYISRTIERPNPGYEQSPEYLRELERRANLGGRLIGVHRLRPSARPLREILGDASFERLQDIWAREGKRYRWSVAFPIIETFAIDDPPDAEDVFGNASYRRLFGHASGMLRSLSAEETGKLGDLEIRALLNLVWVRRREG
jgi:5-methylcytosine-specific restriction enzyme A